MTRIFITLIIGLLCISTVDAQILRDIRRQATRNIERRMQQKAVEVISDEIARRAYQPIEQALDSMLRASFRDSLDNGEEVDWEKAGEAYANFLRGMNAAVDLPERFTFDLAMTIESTDEKGKTNEMIMHYSKDKPILGIENFESENENQFMVIDMEQDLIVLYTTDKKGNKSAQAIPSMLGLMGGMASSTIDDEDYKIERTGATKSILGYSTRLYQSTTDDEYVESYIAENFPVSWQNSFGPYLEKFAPHTYSETANAYNGMVLESTTTSKKDDSKVNVWKTTHINTDTHHIINAEYELRPLIPDEDY